jgi:hypothetical protein
MDWCDLIFPGAGWDDNMVGASGRGIVKQQNRSTQGGLPAFSVADIAGNNA